MTIDKLKMIYDKDTLVLMYCAILNIDHKFLKERKEELEAEALEFFSWETNSKLLQSVYDDKLAKMFEVKWEY